MSGQLFGFLVNMLYEFRQYNYDVTYYYCLYANILIKYTIYSHTREFYAILKTLQ